MKKISFLLLIIMLFSVFAGCGNSAETETASEEETKATREPPSPEYEGLSDEDLDDTMFTYPENRRQAVVDYMYRMAKVEWRTSKKFVLEDKYQGWSYNLEYGTHSTYYGLPFSGRKRGTLQAFLYYLDEDGFYTGDTSINEIIGNVCYDAVYAALVQYCPNVNYDDTSDIFPSDKTGLVHLGEWKEASAKDSQVIIEANTLEEMSKCYAMLDIGDIVAKHNVSKDAGHLRLVVEKPTVEYLSDGSIDFEKSYIVALEQTNVFDKEAKVYTTWYVEHKYTFKKLYEQYFVPMTVADYAEDTNVTAVLYMEADLTNAEELKTKTQLKGKVRSNYNIIGLYFEITDESGNTVYKTAAFPNEKRYYLSKIKLTGFDYSSLPSGKYHVRFTGEIGVGTKVLTEYDFSK